MEKVWGPLRSGHREAGDEVRYTSLTRRQIECLAGAAQGKSTRLIGLELGLGTDVVQTILWEACSRLGVTSHLDAIRIVATLGLITPLVEPIEEALKKKR